MKQEKWKRNLAQFKEAAPAESCSLASQFFSFWPQPHLHKREKPTSKLHFSYYYYFYW
jgi:hypothetical protein